MLELMQSELSLEERKRSIHRAAKRRYYQKNKEQHRASCRKWEADHPEKRAAYSKNWQTNHPEQWRRIRQEHACRKKYGITLDQKQDLFKQQNGLCGLCGLPLTSVCVDHDHQTGVVRGLLHNECNLLIGLAHDNADILRKAAAYVERP